MPTNDGAEAARLERERAERERADREAAEAEQERLAEQKRLQDIAKQKAFEAERDRAAETLRGSQNTTLRSNTSEGSQLRGSGSSGGESELRGSRAVANIPEAFKESEYFYALQTRSLTPMSDGGHPIDAPGSAPVGLRGLVGGTTWTYGFLRPHVKCEPKCTEDMKRGLDSQLSLYCSSDSDPKKCVADGLPFSPDIYDMVVSMGSSHSAIEDLATRVIFDGATFGEFSRQNKEIFASLKGRQFDTLDCHSNGAMLCLAALRSGATTAKEVRLFGPQINPAAAKRWQEYARRTGTVIKVYINTGDPVAAISWKQPTPQTLVGKAVTAVWLTNPVTGPAALAGALLNAYLDSKDLVMDAALKNYGLTVTRSDCKSEPSIDCHSMKLYEKSLKTQKAQTAPK